MKKHIIKTVDSLRSLIGRFGSVINITPGGPIRTFPSMTEVYPVSFFSRHIPEAPNRVCPVQSGDQRRKSLVIRALDRPRGGHPNIIKHCTGSYTGQLHASPIPSDAAAVHAALRASEGLKAFQKHFDLLPGWKPVLQWEQTHALVEEEFLVFAALSATVRSRRRLNSKLCRPRDCHPFLIPSRR